jgi:acyl-CoA synthetase (AMP-forming)/AMP-acid ligase II
LKYVTDQFLKDRMLTYHILEEHAHGPNADALFLIFEDRKWTYAQFFADLQRVGNWLMKDLGVNQGEMVALDGGNSPEYLLVWFALEGIGCATAFINSNLTAQPLIHSATLCDSRYLVTDLNNIHNVGPHESDLASHNVKVIYYSPAFMTSLTDTTPLPQFRRSGIRPDSIRNLIYTSGTTGLPKATIMLSGRELNTGHRIAAYLKLKPGDRMYTAMPLYHGAAHGLLVTPCIHAGATVVLSRKFSHKTFWPEVRKSKANIIQYIGELCRYLINAPPSALDKEHNVKMAWGNGMRPDVWEVFRERFGIPIINELYAATDGLGSSFNANRGDFGRNAVGIRGLLWHLNNESNEVRVRIDVVTQEMMRDKNGFAIKCKAGEPGEVFHRLTAKAAFAGYYQNPAATGKRIVTDVFKKGDLWFRSGDMMMEDADGRLYFVDRLGDTFRWRSENVSTNEVSVHAPTSCAPG